MKQINNNIQESYCSFEVSKLFKEKGMNIWSYAGWTDGKLTTAFRSKIDLHRPTHALAIEWIRQNFDIHLNIIPSYYNIGVLWRCKIHTLFTKQEGKGVGDFNSPQEATEAGLLYILNNLI